ncbi:MAG TPA: glycosyltransferase, partial [Gemmatimonadaceae bacterium]|nr:glycosyltransferase [Gemmatimonadaceae bacterium]
DRPADWKPPAALKRFLASGEPPVYVGFGSMAGRDPQRVTGIVIDALQSVGLRGVLATGWGGLTSDGLPDTMFPLGDVPHDWLFPRMTAVVHHGGAGTTAAGLRAGRPTVICPFFGDQPFWGWRVHELGVGSEPIPQKKLTAGRLAAALRQVTALPVIRRNADALGDKIRSEDGVANAIAVVEQLLPRNAA